jgi:23S rRNA (cytidine1920-2'-O)/16S rRNA (cytidine1409-2'-O)-methyltransferase
MGKGQTRIGLAVLVARRHPEWTSAEVEAAIDGGRVVVDGSTVTNPRARVAAGASMRIVEPPDLAGRRKLAWALERFAVDATGAVVLDVGASTGGFTTAWLAAGASRVYAVDAGHGQLRGTLRQDPRVVNLERTNVAILDSAVIADPVARVSVDVSYLALSEAVGQLDRVPLAPGAQLLGLVKPMFELRLATIPTDTTTLDTARIAAISGIEAAGWVVLDSDECPVRGGRGAVEFMVHGRRAR